MKIGKSELKTRLGLNLNFRLRFKLLTESFGSEKTNPKMSAQLIHILD